MIDWLSRLDWSGVTVVALLVGVIGMAGFAAYGPKSPDSSAWQTAYNKPPVTAPASRSQHTHSIFPS